MITQTDERYTDYKKFRPEEELYIALSELDFSWYEAEMTEVIKFWNDGCHITKIAQCMRRDTDEVAILIMDLARQGIIGERKGGCFGNLF